MPSRKKAQGKARKAAKADNAKDAASVPPKDFTDLTFDSWLTCDDESERCKHGCDLSLPKSEHDCRDFAMRFAKDFRIELCPIDSSEVFQSPSKVKWAISFYHSRGTQDVMDGNMKRAHHAAICAR
eukprot:scaffold32388_cov61-Skeletonema_dohrnii-CCMP3373.AAC.1